MLRKEGRKERKKERGRKGYPRFPSCGRRTVVSLWKEGRKEGKKEGRKDGRKEGGKEVRTDGGKAERKGREGRKVGR